MGQHGRGNVGGATWEEPCGWDNMGGVLCWA